MTTILDLKNPRLLEDGRIRLDALFDDSPNGLYESHVVCPHDAPTAARHAAALAGEFGPIAPYLPPSEQALYDGAAHYTRIQRDGLLRDTDWTQLPDVPESTKERWALYRQELRDVSSQQGFPFNVAWPVEPT